MARRILMRWAILAIAIALTAWLLPGITVLGETLSQQLTAVVIIALIFGLVNAILGPILKLLTCSLIILTLGLFSVVINTALFYLTAQLLPNQLTIDGFWWALGGSLVISIVSAVLSAAISDE